MIIQLETAAEQKTRFSLRNALKLYLFSRRRRICRRQFKYITFVSFFNENDLCKGEMSRIFERISPISTQCERRKVREERGKAWK